MMIKQEIACFKPDEQIEGGAFGTIQQGQFIEVASSRKNSDTPEHEVEHTLNLGHFLTGLMKEIDKEERITRESIVTKENVQQIIDFAIGTGDTKSPTAPAYKAKTIVTNPNKEKVEGTVIENNKKDE